MFQLTKEEWESISSQFVMTSRAKRPKSSLPYAFTEQGVAMLSGLLNSDIAINTNIVVMRAFVLIRQHEYPKNYEHAKYNDGFQRFFGGWGLCKKNCYPYIHDEKQIEIFSQQYKIMCAGRLPTIILEIFAELKQGVTALKLKMEY